MKDLGVRLKSIQLLDCLFTDSNSNKIFQYSKLQGITNEYQSNNYYPLVAEYCPLIESIEISSVNPEKPDLYSEADLEPLLDCPNLHTIIIDGLVPKNLDIIKQLLKKVWKLEFSYSGSWRDEIIYCPERNIIICRDYDTWKCSQFPEPKDTDTDP